MDCFWGVCKKWQRKVKTCYTSSVPSLGNVYGSASWKRLGLNAQLCWNAVAVLLQHYWENPLRSVLHSPCTGSNKCGFPSMQQFESHRGNMWEWGGNQPVLQVAKKTWHVIIERCQVLRHSLLLLLQTQGIAQVLLITRRLWPPCPAPACQLLFPRIVPLSLTGCHLLDVPLWLTV